MSDDGYQQLFAHLTRNKRRTAKGRCAVAPGSKAPAFSPWMKNAQERISAWGVAAPTNPDWYATEYKKQFGVDPVRSNNPVRNAASETEQQNGPSSGVAL